MTSRPIVLAGAPSVHARTHLHHRARTDGGWAAVLHPSDCEAARPVAARRHLPGHRVRDPLRPRAVLGPCTSRSSTISIRTTRLPDRATRR